MGAERKGDRIELMAKKTLVKALSDQGGRLGETKRERSNAREWVLVWLQENEGRKGEEWEAAHWLSI